MTRRALLPSLIVTTLASPASAVDIPTAFMVSKSNNKNQVHYAVDVGATCAPVGSAPVHPYWRMLEKGAQATEPLEGREERAFGIREQVIEGNSVRIVLRALPARPIMIRTWRTEDGACACSAHTSIAGTSARLFNIHVALRLFAVDYLLFTGWTDDGAVLRERMDL